MISELYMGVGGIDDIIKISEDHMSVVMYIPLPEDGENETAEGLIDLLNIAGVKSGINKEVIINALDKGLYGVPLLVAEGKAAVDGEDGYFTYTRKPEAKSNSPRINDDGTVDYVVTEEFLVVAKGDVIATYTHATAGEFGYSVDGKLLTPKKGKEQTPLRGKGFVVEDNQYIADIDGKLDLGNKTITISPILEIHSDVDISTGHIDFLGDIIIRGDITSGMKVKSGGAIMVYGHVGAALVIAAKDITIKKGVQGKEKGKLDAGGDIVGTFFEKVNIRAKGTIVANSIMDCYVEAGGLIKVTGKQGLILGGTIDSIEGVEAKTVGNEAEVITRVKAGITEKMLARHSELSELITKVNGEMDLLDRSAKIFERMEKTKVTKETENRRMKIIRAKVIKDTELKGYIKSFAEICEDISRGKDAVILVRGIVYRGTRVEVRGVRYNVRETSKDVVFRLRGKVAVMEGNR